MWVFSRLCLCVGLLNDWIRPDNLSKFFRFFELLFRWLKNSAWVGSNEDFLIFWLIKGSMISCLSGSYCIRASYTRIVPIFSLYLVDY